jgi:chromosome segregation ATPase
MDEAFETLVSRKAQEAEDAVLTALREEVQSMGEKTTELLRQKLDEQRMLLGIVEATLGSFRKEAMGTLSGLRSDLSRLGADLREEMKDKHGKLERRQEAVAAEQKKLLESILRQTDEARKQLQALHGVLSAQEQTLTGKQDSLRDGLGALQKELPEQFHNRRELGEILNRMITEQRSLFEQSTRAMKRQIRIAQILGFIAALLSLIAWLATRT